MAFLAAVQNALIFVVPMVIYAVFVRWRAGLSAGEIAQRLALGGGERRDYGYALLATVPLVVLSAAVTGWTSSFEGSMLAPFLDKPVSATLVFWAFNYGFIATGIPEELLFRGLIAGALERRMGFAYANVLQAAIFTLPHLLILFVDVSLWPLAVLLPMVLGMLAGWLRHRSSSVWPGVLLHALPNMAGALWVLDWS